MDQILIIEDDRRTAEWISIYLKRAGFNSDVVSDGIAGKTLSHTKSYDLVLLDLMLPGIDGISLCKSLRGESDIPVIMVTARVSPSDKIKGLEIGADDYITKPFDPDELVMRIKTVLRRSGKCKKHLLTYGLLTLDEENQYAALDGDEIKLSRSQFAILSLFIKSPGRIFSREMIIELAFNNDFRGYNRAIDTHIQRLRKIIHTDDFQPIKAIYGLGYKLQ